MNKSVKKVAVSLFFSLIALSNITASAAEIGLIDETRLLTEYSGSKTAQAQIAELRTKMQDLLTELNSSLEKSNGDKSLTEAQKAQKQKDAEKRFISERENAEKVAATLREKVESDVQVAINEEAKAQSLSLVVSKDVTFFGGKDITEAVLKRLDKK